MSNNVESNTWVDLIEESIAKKQIKYYDYKYFNNIQEIGFGSFGKVYRANWKNSHNYFALKSFANFNIITKEIVNEFKLRHEVDFHENIIQFYGITTENESDNSKKYLLVMEYADSNTLRNYLSERFGKLTWNDKLNLALQLANAILYLHDKEIVHRNLHPNNILIHKNTIKLTDFELSSNILKMVAYVDPQIFNIKRDNNDQIQVNKKNNIYSIGILLWEISSGRPPFCTNLYDDDLTKKISQGLREKPISNTPADYVKVYTDCWNNDPDNRPTIKEVVMKLNTIISEENIQLSSSKKQNIFEIPKNVINNPLQEEMSQYFNKIDIKEMEPSISLDNDFDIIVNEIILLLENIEIERKRNETSNYLNDHNITLTEIYDWLLNSQNNSNSVFLLGVFNHFGIGINVNKQMAFELYRKAANSGNVFGITSLGFCYINGIGTSFNGQRAFYLCKKAAKLGNRRGICNLGCCYENQIGTIANYNKAFELYQKAANLGNIRAINNLGGCYNAGIGTTIDVQKAFELYQKAAILGDSLAQYNLATMYNNGRGVKKDLEQALYWYKKSNR
ncbi:hypothetical protein RclHR1_04780015 [Rhizophagus clarus]|uniref:Kinase-like domain-containing protein n=1 Tax=Rhizophagus clarus TaxID=94130 RepID=A0A2Z6RIR1_9GLOM|nr:hypothetical protein RclHR1_04780015 [Rhizophagus clarus]GES87936.1 kinase-like domain-containing protein [Rhizophagus clarus]